jgi:ribosome-binding factor A
LRHSPRGFNRTDRVADQIQKDLAVLLQRELKDPRVGMATVSSVKVSKDFSFADVYVSFMDRNTPEEAEQAVAILEKAAGFLRSQLARGINLRVMPRLRFHFDATLMEGPRLSALIDKAVKEDKARHPDDDDDSEASVSSD